mmetsp:Transcript_13835/g.59206  ORF Transcript_13835/g.59206 Transcript_13835/m.59206 type:complete len:238 (+) Transcript_13835:916-1629(+)
MVGEHRLREPNAVVRLHGDIRVELVALRFASVFVFFRGSAGFEFFPDLFSFVFQDVLLGVVRRHEHHVQDPPRRVQLHRERVGVLLDFFFVLLRRRPRSRGPVAPPLSRGDARRQRLVIHGFLRLGEVVVQRPVRRPSRLADRLGRARAQKRHRVGGGRPRRGQRRARAAVRGEVVPTFVFSVRTSERLERLERLRAQQPVEILRAVRRLDHRELLLQLEHLLRGLALQALEHARRR